MGGVPQRVAGGSAHLLGGGDRAVEPGMLDHTEDDGKPPPLLAEQAGERPVILDLGRGVGAVAHLVLEAEEAEARVARPIGQPAGEEEAGETGGRLRQGEEGVRHRGRAEPFMAGEAIPAGLARGFGAGGVGPHVRSPLFLGHRHADGNTRLLRGGAAGGVVAAGEQAGEPVRRHLRCGAQRRDGGVAHAHRAGGAGIGLRDEGEDRRMPGMPAGGHSCAVQMLPGQRHHAGLEAEPHQGVVGGMEAHLIEAPSLGVEGLEHRGAEIGLPPPGLDLRRARPHPEHGEDRLVLGRAALLHGEGERGVGGVEVDVLERRGLVEDLVGGEVFDRAERGHRALLWRDVSLRGG